MYIFSNDHNIINSLICGTKSNFLWNSLNPFVKFLKVNLGLGGRKYRLLQKDETAVLIFFKNI